MTQEESKKQALKRKFEDYFKFTNLLSKRTNNPTYLMPADFHSLTKNYFIDKNIDIIQIMNIRTNDFDSFWKIIEVFKNLNNN
jgi:hypothetical protein